MSEQLLQQILDTQKQILSALSNPPVLGLSHQLPAAQFIYANRKHGSLWYTVQGDEPTPLNFPALYGIVKEIAFPEVTRRGELVRKIHVTVQAGEQTYCIEAGHDSNVSRCILAAFGSQEPGSLYERVVCFCPRPGEKPEVLFMSVYHGSEYLKGVWPEDIDNSAAWRPIAIAARAAISPPF